MQSQFPYWLTHLVLAECIGANGTVIGKDPSELPLVSGNSGIQFHTASPVSHLVLTKGGGRYLENVMPFAGASLGAGPILLVTDDLALEDIASIQARIPRAPNLLLHHGSTDVPGFRPMGDGLPGLFIATSADNVGLSLTQASQDYTDRKRDSFSSLQTLCTNNPALTRAHFDPVGDALMGHNVLPLLRGLSRASAQELLLSGVVRLWRWQPVTIRVPVYGLDDPKVHLRFAGRADPGTIACSCTDGAGLLVLDHTKDKHGETLCVQLSCRRRLVVDVTLSGHDIELIEVSVRLPALHRPGDGDQIDPLDRFADPLATYG